MNTCNRCHRPVAASMGDIYDPDMCNPATAHGKECMAAAAAFRRGAEWAIAMAKEGSAIDTQKSDFGDGYSCFINWSDADAEMARRFK